MIEDLKKIKEALNADSVELLLTDDVAFRITVIVGQYRYAHFYTFDLYENSYTSVADLFIEKAAKELKQQEELNPCPVLTMVHKPNTKQAEEKI